MRGHLQVIVMFVCELTLKRLRSLALPMLAVVFVLFVAAPREGRTPLFPTTMVVNVSIFLVIFLLSIVWLVIADVRAAASAARAEGMKLAEFLVARRTRSQR